MARTAGPPRAVAVNPLRERVFGAALALYLLAGSWSLARVLPLEPSLLWQPRCWAVFALAALAARDLVVRQPRPETRRPSLLATELAWLGFSLLALAWAPELEIGTDAAVDIAMMMVVAVSLHGITRRCALAPLLRSTHRATLALLALMAAAALVGGLSGGRLATLGGGPNVFGRNMGLLCVLALERALSAGEASAERPRFQSVWPVIAACSAMLVALSGSRGAMLATGAALGCLLVMGRARLARRVLVLGAVLILGLGIVAFTEVGARVAESFAERVVQLLFRERYVSSRDQIYAFALEEGAQRPLIGHGLASFRTYTPWVYAHNIFLDAWFETGAVGVGLLGMYLGSWGRALKRPLDRRPVSRPEPARDHAPPPSAAFWAAALLILVASQFSGGRFDARGLLVFASLSLLARPPSARGS